MTDIMVSYSVWHVCQYKSVLLSRALLMAVLYNSMSTSLATVCPAIQFSVNSYTVSENVGNVSVRLCLQNYNNSVVVNDTTVSVDPQSTTFNVETIAESAGKTIRALPTDDSS